jgi:type I restriction enzyme S subunit
LQIPDLPAQRQIAAILSAYDELIENNQRRIALLEKLAEEIYREWFVRLRFPGHENVKVVKGVPKGWEQKRLPDVADITYGFPFEGSRFNGNGIGRPIIRIRNIPESSTTDYTDEVAGDKYIVRHGDLLIGMDGEFHINHWHGNDAYLVQRVCRLKAKQPALEGYLAHAIRAPIKHFESILMGATVGHLGATHLKGVVLLVPPEPFYPQLHILNDIHQQKLTFAKMVRNLAESRDKLLPRLVSGKLPVENLDIQFPPGMAEELNAESATVSLAMGKAKL